VKQGRVNKQSHSFAQLHTGLIMMKLGNYLKSVKELENERKMGYLEEIILW